MKLTILDYPIYMKIGHFRSEKDFAREVYLSLELEFFLDIKKFDDKIQNTLDYSAVTRFLEDNFSYKTFDLVETVLIAIGKDLICQFHRVNSVFVKLDKSFMSKKVSKNAKLAMEHFFKREDFL